MSSALKIELGGTALTPEQAHAQIVHAVRSGRLKKSFEQYQREAYNKAFRAAVDETMAARAEFKAFGGKCPDELKARKRFQSLEARFGTPSADDVHIDALLSGVLADQPQAQFIAPLVLPFLPVSKRSGKIQPLDRRAGKNASFDDNRAPGAPANEIGFALGTRVDYDVENHSVKVPIPNEAVANQDDPIDLEGSAQRYTRDVVLLKHEIRAVTLLTTAANYPTANRLTTTTKWDNADTTNIEPKRDMLTAHNLIRQSCGMPGNRAFLSYPMVQALVVLDDYRQRVQYVSESFDRMLWGKLAEYIDVEEVAIGMAVYDTANPGATASYSDVWPDDCVIYRHDPGTDVHFAYAPAMDVGTAETWDAPDRDRRARFFGYNLECDEIIVTSAHGVHIDDTLT